MVEAVSTPSGENCYFSVKPVWLLSHCTGEETEMQRAYMPCQDLMASQGWRCDWGLDPLTTPGSGFFLEHFFVSNAGQMALMARMKAEHGLVVQVL